MSHNNVLKITPKNCGSCDALFTEIPMRAYFAHEAYWWNCTCGSTVYLPMSKILLFFDRWISHHEADTLPCERCGAPNDSNNLESKNCIQCDLDISIAAAEALEDV